MNGLAYTRAEPPPTLAPFVESYWMLRDTTGRPRELVILPDGRIDLFFAYATADPFHVTLAGVGTGPQQATLPAGAHTFAVSLHPLAVEYLLGEPVADLLDGAVRLSPKLWELDRDGIDDFPSACARITEVLLAKRPPVVDPRKRTLFDLLTGSQGTLPVAELGRRAFWSPRQINRYFRHWLGLPLKTYADILRYRATFKHIRAGRFTEVADFADQSHLIRTVRRYSGVSPTALRRDANGRFVQFSTLGPR